MKERVMKNATGFQAIKIGAAIAALFVAVTNVWAQSSGGVYELEQSALAGGGDTSMSGSGNPFSVTGTVGQPIAGSRSANGRRLLEGGFWTHPAFNPTAAEVTISGRVLTPTGLGLRNARVVLTAMSGESRTAFTGPFGYYRFDAVPSGETYVINVVSKQYLFTEQVLFLFGQLDGFDLVVAFNTR
jgi:hypothetical protein